MTIRHDDGVGAFPTSYRAPRIEPLEPRLLLSGVTVKMRTVNVTLKGGTLTIDAFAPKNDLDFFLDDGALEYALFNSGAAHSFPRDQVQRVVVNGGRSHDNLDFTGSLIPVTINARGGNDRIDGGRVGDKLDGGPGDDEFGSSNFGADVIRGGPGYDRLSFAARDFDLDITLDGKPNDGQNVPGHPPENMNVGADIEEIIGGNGNDRIVGNAFANVLNGGPGDDTILGGAGNDILIGGPGADLLEGQGGNDTLLAADHQRDRLNGGKGLDVFSGDADDDLYKIEVTNVVT